MGDFNPKDFVYSQGFQIIYSRSLPKWGVIKIGRQMQMGTDIYYHAVFKYLYPWEKHETEKAADFCLSVMLNDILREVDKKIELVTTATKDAVMQELRHQCLEQIKTLIRDKNITAWPTIQQ